MLKTLRQRCHSISMPLKPVGIPCPNLLGGDVAEYVGFAVQICDGAPQITLPGRVYDRLAVELARCHQFPMAPVRAIQLVRGWFAQQGPVWESEDRQGVVATVRQLACEAGFDELPEDGALLCLWSAGYERWESHRNPALQ